MKFDDISREDALAALFALWTPRTRSVLVPVDRACGYITHGDVLSENSQPVERASEMDGVAVSSDAFAGTPPDTAAFRPGTDYVRADTGDDFDDRFDAVIPIENVDMRPDGGFRVTGGIKIFPGMNVDPRGASLAEGDALLRGGRRIRPCDIPALVRGGVKKARVRRPPVVAFIPTGDELVPQGQKPGRGQAVDANSALARHMLREAGARPLCLPIVKDRDGELEAALNFALAKADIVLLNGGSSKGHADLNAELLKRRGRLVCHGTNAAPGRPVCVCVIDGRPVINVPGPPLAAYCVFDWCVRAVVARALGVEPERHPTARATLTADLETPASLYFYNRLRLRRTDGGYEADPVSLYRDGGLYFIGVASGQFVSPPGKGFYPKGSVIEAELLCKPEYL